MLTLTAAIHADCTLQLSAEGVVRLASGEQQTLSWNEVPGATSYYVETLIEGLNEPSGPDFMFGAPYTESRNFEARNVTSTRVQHAVLYKMRFRYIVTALNREDPTWVPCKDDVLYVVEADETMATIAGTRYIPMAGRAPGANGANFSTAVILTGTGIGVGQVGGDAEAPKLYQGRIYFRPLGTAPSDTDPSIPYALDGDDTVVIDDIMASLGATGTGTIEVVSNLGLPSPLVDAVIENRAQDGRRFGTRIPALWGRDQLNTNPKVVFPLRSATDSRVAVGVRSLGGHGSLIIQHVKSNGTVAQTANEFGYADTTTLFALHELFAGPFEKGDRITVRYNGFQFTTPDGPRFPPTRGVILFLTETGNDFNNPNIVYREAMDGWRYAFGFDRFLVY